MALTEVHHVKGVLDTSSGTVIPLPRLVNPEQLPEELLIHQYPAACRGHFSDGVSKGERRELSPLVDRAVERRLITAVTLAELSVGPLVATSETERAARQADVQQAAADFDPLPFDASAARAFGNVAASLPQAGRKT